MIVDVARGFELRAPAPEVEIRPGQTELDLTLDRWVDMNGEGWYSGDSHVHFLSAQGSHLEANGEDLDVVNMLQSQWGSLFTDTQEFTGGVSSDGESLVYVSQENRQHFLGHLILWGLKEPVMPWCSDGPGEAEIGGTLEVTMSDWADQCRGQGGTVVIPHLPNPNGEPATLIATGRADAVEMLRHGPFEHQEYYRYLNCGYRLPLVGGTDKMSNEVPVGLYRTYVRIPEDEPFTYDNWCANVARGRTFHSGGPILRLKVDGCDIGDTLRLPGNGGTVEVEAQAESVVPIHTLQIVQEGRVVASADDAGGTRALKVEAKVEVRGNSWIAARCAGPGYTGGGAPRRLGAVDHGPHLAGLPDLRRGRVVDVRREHRPVHAHPRGRLPPVTSAARAASTRPAPPPTTTAAATTWPTWSRPSGGAGSDPPPPPPAPHPTLRGGDRMIVDSHLHVWSADLERYPVAEGREPREAAPVELLNENMAAAGVDQAVIVQAIGYMHDNRYVADCLRRFPGRFAGTALIDQKAPDAPDVLEKLVREDGIIGLRIHLASRVDHPSLWATPDQDPLWRKAEEIGANFTLYGPAAHLEVVEPIVARFPASRSSSTTWAACPAPTRTTTTASSNTWSASPATSTSTSSSRPSATARRSRSPTATPSTSTAGSSTPTGRSGSCGGPTSRACSAARGTPPALGAVPAPPRLPERRGPPLAAGRDGAGGLRPALTTGASGGAQVARTRPSFSTRACISSNSGVPSSSHNSERKPRMPASSVPVTLGGET